MLDIVLLAPEIPANTGNIGRTCAVTGARLHLIRPLGFSLDDGMVKRAGLDYWEDLDVHVHDSFERFLEDEPQAADGLFLFTKKTTRLYTEVSYPAKSYLVFGRESSGIPESILVAHPEACVRIPMLPDCEAIDDDAFSHTRVYAQKNRQRSAAGEVVSLNLSDAVAIGAYEALRQQGFPGLQREGHLNRLEW